MLHLVLCFCLQYWITLTLHTYSISADDDYNALSTNYQPLTVPNPFMCFIVSTMENREVDAPRDFTVSFAQTVDPLTVIQPSSIRVNILDDDGEWSRVRVASGHTGLVLVHMKSSFFCCYKVRPIVWVTRGVPRWYLIFKMAITFVSLNLQYSFWYQTTRTFYYFEKFLG